MLLIPLSGILNDCLSAAPGDLSNHKETSGSILNCRKKSSEADIIYSNIIPICYLLKYSCS